MVYTEENLFADCAKEKANQLKSDAKTYKAVWVAFCKWIVETFEKGRGVSIVYLMTLSWVRDPVEEAIYKGRVLRPVWRMSESFEKAFSVTFKNKSDRRSPYDLEKFVKVIHIRSSRIVICAHFLPCHRVRRSTFTRSP